MKKLLLIYLICLSGLSYGQKQQIYLQNVKPSDQDVLQKNQYSADRIMDMREELKLTDAQSARIKKIHSENAGKFSEEKWDLDEETAKLKKLLDQPKIDQTAMQKQLDKVLALENSLKKRQLSSMAAIKNELTESQQAILNKSSFYTIRDSNSGIGSVNGQNLPRLNGTVSGLAVTDNPSVTSITSNPKLSIQLAGTSATDQPLYLMDTKEGMIPITDLKEINPNSIESINVLKDKSAVEKFGEKGKNGVIIIKLKDDPKK